MVSKTLVHKKGDKVEGAYQEIKKMIYFNMVAPGQKLGYKDIAEKLNISITPVIQALKALERSEFVRYQPNRGYYVSEISISEARQLYEAREALESFCIRCVVQNLDNERLDSVIKAFKEYRAATEPENRRMLMMRDAEFHLEIVKFYENKVIFEHLKTIFEQIYLKYKPEYLWEDRIREAIKEHRMIIKSIRTRDVDSTVNLVKTHIQNGLYHVTRNLEMNVMIDN